MSEYDTAFVRDYLRANHPDLNVGKRGRISAEAQATFDADVAKGIVPGKA